MTDKEKAKAYDEALKKASAAYKDEDRHLKATLERIFPELKESEDEKIKKAIIEFFKSEDDNTTYSLIRKKDIIAWLEKQGKQKKQVHFPKFTFDDVLALQCCMETVKKVQEDKELYEQLNLIHSKMYDAYWLEKQGKNSTDKIKPRFKVGDWIVNEVGYSWHIDSLDKKNYKVSDEMGNYNYFPISEQNEMQLWDIQDAEDGDVLACNEEILLFKSYSELQGRISLYCWYNGHTNNFHSKEVIDTVMTIRNKICPATKEQRSTLMKVMNNAGYEWDAENKELKKKD